MPFRWPNPLHCNSTAPDDIILHSPSSSKHPPLPRSHGTILDKTFSDRFHDNTIDRTVLRLLANNIYSCSSEQSPSSSPLPTLSKLPHAHPSLRTLEIIFRSGWIPVPVRIQALFRVRHSPPAIAAFEDRRAAARRRDSGDARCSADGNEMMRFYGGGKVERCRVGGVEGVRTFAGSGGAHGKGGGKMNMMMMVCRVIAGRVGDPEEVGSGRVDSVRVGEGEMLVLDARAVLPCFLIVYEV